MTELDGDVRKVEAPARAKTMTINKLPNELLISIFPLDIQHDRENRRMRPWQKSQRWVRLMLVCRRWREIALATPTLWRYLDVSLYVKDEWIELCISRSSPATIDVTFSVLEYRCITKFHHRLVPEAYRIRRLRYDNLQTANIGDVLAFLDHEMPALEALHFPTMLPTDRGSSVTLDDLTLSRDRFPRLHHLDLKCTAAPLDPLLYQNLTRLFLERCRCKFSFGDFLVMLAEASATLEVLRLRRLLPHIHNGWTDALVSGKKPINFTRLSFMSLEDDPVLHTSRILPFLIPLPTASVRIAPMWNDPQELDTQETIGMVLPPNPSAFYPILATTTEVLIIARPGANHIICGLAGGRGFRASKYRARFSIQSDSPALSLTDALADLREICASAPLKSLWITTEQASGVDATEWERLFLTFPLLEEVHVRLAIGQAGVDGVVDTMFEGLCSPLRLDADSASDGGSGVPCMQLTSISVTIENQTHITTRVLDAALECLRYREQRGTRLNSLTMSQVWKFVDTAAYAPYTDKLERLVETVILPR